MLCHWSNVVASVCGATLGVRWGPDCTVNTFCSVLFSFCGFVPSSLLPLEGAVDPQMMCLQQRGYIEGFLKILIQESSSVLTSAHDPDVCLIPGPGSSDRMTF